MYPLFAWTAPYLMLLPVFLILRRWPGWRLDWSWDPSDVATRHRQFSLRHLLAMTSVLCVLLAMARWTHVPVQWSQATTIWMDASSNTFWTALVYAMASLSLVPLVALVLGQEHRGRHVWTSGAALIVALLFVACARPSWMKLWDNLLILTGGWLWALACLLILRAGGWRCSRIVRSTNDGPT
ncbi:MAG: hypothetical protein AB7E98_24820 [Pirellulales bacterium]